MTTFAMVFPGQGSQSVGMMQAYGDLPGIRETFAEASDVLKQDLWKLVAEGPVEALNLTINTQPVMLTAAVAVYRAWMALGGATPVVVAGHSLGEFSALVAADVLPLASAVALVRFRASEMQKAVPAGLGGMAAIVGLDDAGVKAACEEAVAANPAQVAQAVNFNAPGQVVIAGHVAAVERATLAAKARGAKLAVMLPVSGPFHSSLMQPAADALKHHLDGIALAIPAIPVINNVDVAAVADSASIKDALVRQAASPVRWVETIEMIAEQGVTHLVECGPGKVLTGLTKRIRKDLIGIALTDEATVRQALEALNDT